MATENIAIAGYFPEAIHKAIGEYCRENGLVRKDGSPMYGSGVVAICESFFGLGGEAIAPSGKLEELTARLDSIDREVELTETAYRELGGEVEVIAARLTRIDELLLNLSEGSDLLLGIVEGNGQRLGAVEAAIAELEARENHSSSEQAAIAELEGWESITQRAIAELEGVNPTTVWRWSAEKLEELGYRVGVVGGRKTYWRRSPEA
jgi:hypothetical protein